MKHFPKKQKRTSQDEMMEQVHEILIDRGSQALEIARNEVLQEKIECKEAREALNYFITEYWQDFARPALLSLTCEAIGGDPRMTTPIAIPMVLISGAIDIHDDIIDHSKVKGSRPTVLGKFGKDIALLVGDGLLFKGFTLLYKAVEKGIPTKKINAIIGIIEEMFFELGDAEALELQFRRKTNVSPGEYLHMVRKKAADVEAHTRISAILGNGSEDEMEALGKYGRLLGTLILLRDDLIDMIEFEEIKHRIKWECLPLPMLYALQDPEARSKLGSLLVKKAITRRDSRTILELTDKAGGFEHANENMRELVQTIEYGIKNLKGSKEYLLLLARSMQLDLSRWRNLAC